MTPFDWSQELDDDELLDRFQRVSGEVVCEICGEPYWRHPDEPRMLSGIDGKPYLKRLCNGWLGKL